MISTSGAGPKPCFVNKVLLEHSRVQLVCILSVPATETLWPVKPQIIRKWSFSKEVCWSLLCLKLSMLQAVLKIRSKYTLMKGILSFQGRELREISPGFLSKVTMQRIVSSTAFLTDFLWFPALLLMMDNTYTCVYHKEFSGRRTQRDVGTKCLTPLAKSKDKIQMDQRKQQWLFTVRTYCILALCQALFYVPHINTFILTEILFRVSTVFYPHLSEGKTETGSSKDCCYCYC